MIVCIENFIKVIEKDDDDCNEEKKQVVADIIDVLPALPPLKLPEGGWFKFIEKHGNRMKRKFPEKMPFIDDYISIARELLGKQ